MVLNSKVILFFGLAGAGKTFCASLLATMTNRQQYEADQDLTPAMLNAIKLSNSFTEEMRDEYYELIGLKISDLIIHGDVIVSQGLYKNKHRKYLLKIFPQLQLVHVTAPEDLILERVKIRNNEIDVNYVKKIAANFENPTIPVLTLVNDGDMQNLKNQFLTLGLINLEHICK